MKYAKKISVVIHITNDNITYLCGRVVGVEILIASKILPTTDLEYVCTTCAKVAND